MSNFSVGNKAIFATAFSVAGVYTDPTTVRGAVYLPDGTSYTKTYPDADLIKTGTGLYEFSVSLTQEGRWRIVMSSSGTAQGANGYVFNVEPLPTP